MNVRNKKIIFKSTWNFMFSPFKKRLRHFQHRFRILKITFVIHRETLPQTPAWAKLPLVAVWQIKSVVLCMSDRTGQKVWHSPSLSSYQDTQWRVDMHLAGHTSHPGHVIRTLFPHLSHSKQSARYTLPLGLTWGHWRTCKNWYELVVSCCLQRSPSHYTTRGTTGSHLKILKYIGIGYI